MAKKQLVGVPQSLIDAIKDLQRSRYWTQLPMSMRERIDKGIGGKEIK